MDLNLDLLVNVGFWFVIYSVAAYLLIMVFSNVEGFGFPGKNKPASSAAVGLVGTIVSTIIDAVATSSSQGPVTNLTLLPLTLAPTGPPPAIPPYLGTLIVFAAAFVIVYVVARSLD